jgi:hypothetical protein
MELWKLECNSKTYLLVWKSSVYSEEAGKRVWCLLLFKDTVQPDFARILSRSPISTTSIEELLSNPHVVGQVEKRVVNRSLLHKDVCGVTAVSRPSIGPW